ncbi:MAG: LysR family transcriptional regulator [Gracilibacteraceae bacterium]|jgi:DNA-binding transcriptional LysR family regulator|nr:LysR family transcriptional regulator [Gracilibacteraceae bacterium]
METEYLKYIIDIAQTNSITTSAKRLSISQQRLSQIVMRFEEDLGTALFYRNNRGVWLTEDGEYVISMVQEIGDRINFMRSKLKGRRQQPAAGSAVKVGAVPYIMGSYFCKICELFHDHHPQIDVLIQEKKFTEIIQGVDEGGLDIGLIVNVSPYIYHNYLLVDSRTYVKYYVDELVAFVDRESPLAGRKLIHHQDLKDNTVASNDFEVMSQEINNNYVPYVGYTTIKTNSNDMLRHAVTKGRAIGLTFVSNQKILGDPQFVVIPLDGNNKTEHGCLISRSRAPTEPVTDFVGAIKEFFKAA